jgi:magnesium-transporting ATPase (P-type)
MLSGAPEIITKRCDKYAADQGAEYKMDTAYMEAFDAAYEHFGTQAWQTLSLAFKVYIFRDAV